MHKKTKKLLLLTAAILLGVNASGAVGLNNSLYYDKGAFYTNTSFPQSVALAENARPTDEELKKLKKGIVNTGNIFMLIEAGDAGIMAAAKKAGITKIHYVDTRVSKIYVPLLFIPIYIKNKETIVYGE